MRYNYKEKNFYKMIIIEQSIILNISKELDLDDLKTDFIKSPLVSDAYLCYNVLTYHSEKFLHVPPLEIYYNRYYYFTRFLYFHTKEFGYDSGLEQMEFKVINEAETFLEINWSELENISNKAKTE